MYSKGDEPIERIEAGLHFKEWDYAIMVSDWLLRKDLQNVAIWKLMIKALINKENNNGFKQIASIFARKIYTLTGKNKWLLKSIRWNYKAKANYDLIKAKMNLEMKVFAFETLYEISEKALDPGIDLCHYLLELGRIDEALKVAEEMYERLGEYVEIMEVLQKIGFIQLYSKNRPETLPQQH